MAKILAPHLVDSLRQHESGTELNWLPRMVCFQSVYPIVKEYPPQHVNSPAIKIISHFQELYLH